MNKNNIEKKSNSFYSVLGVIFFCAATFVLGLLIGKQSDALVNPIINYKLVGNLMPTAEKAEELDFSLFWEVWDLLENKFVESNLDERQMFNGAIKGLVSSLDDSATVFYSSEETEELERVMAGNFEGIGAELGYRNGQIIVKSPLKGYPAYREGLRAGDAILEIDGVSTSGMDIIDAVLKIRGERGTEVILNILPLEASEPNEVEIIRDSIHVESIEWADQGDTAIIEVRRFTEDSLTAWLSSWNNVISEVEKTNPSAIILDLRGNTGGYFDAAIWAAGEFLPNRTVISYQEGRNGQKVDFKVNREGKLLDKELIILIDEGSASASEILAGAVKHYNRGLLIGKPSFGKGTAQQILTLDDGSSLRVTTQKWLLPDGSWINSENKIFPDLEIEFPKESFEKGEDPQLDRAFSEINKD